MTNPPTKSTECANKGQEAFAYKGIPEEEAWLPSQLLFAWERPLFRRAAALKKEGKALEFEDLLPLMRIDYSERLGAKFEEAWNKLTSAQQSHPEEPKIDDVGNSKKTPRMTAKIRKTLLEVMGWRFIAAGFVKAINTTFQFSFPLLLNQILKFIEEAQAGVFDASDPWYDRYRGYWLSGLLFLFMACKAMSESKYFHMVNRAGWEAKAAVSVAVYNKSLRMSSSERQSTTLGELVNLMQVDASKIEMFVPQVHVLWDGMFQILGYMVRSSPECDEMAIDIQSRAPHLFCHLTRCLTIHRLAGNPLFVNWVAMLCWTRHYGPRRSNPRDRDEEVVCPQSIDRQDDRCSCRVYQ
jgi:ABC transporter transmembrane region